MTVTPLGGSSSEAHWFDASGHPCDPEAAVSGEIVEFDEDGVVLGRTYMEPPEADPAVPTGQAPNSSEAFDPENADFTKGTWDLWVVRDGVWEHRVETLDELLVVLEVQDADLTTQRQNVGSLMGLPAWDPAPQSLRDQVNAWMTRTRQE